jgi:hemin uptake protein HemP
MTPGNPDNANAAEQERRDVDDVVETDHDCIELSPSTYDFEHLACGAKSIMICLGMTLYTLRRTRTGKLVLNK